ncbi:hypothetical protein [Maribacter sp.]|uniref:hypothetical protein n=1 Tax=Maribacter sp. TaxID=1897614 RepID=UPI0025C1586D|nr:hypothetical protein [Maribacter sp.]
MKKHIFALFFFFCIFLLHAQEYNSAPILSFELINGKEVTLKRTNIYFLQYQITNNENEIEFTFPTNNKNSTTNYFVYDETRNAYNLTFRNKNAIYTIYQNTLTDEIGVLVTIDNETYNLKGKIETLNGSIKIFKATYPTISSNQFVNIQYKSSFILPSLKEIISDIKSGTKKPSFNELEEHALYNLSDENIRLHNTPNRKHNDKFKKFVQNSIVALESKNIEKIFTFFNSKYLFWLLHHHSYGRELDSSIKDRFSSFSDTGKYKKLNYKEFETVEFVEVFGGTGSNDLVFIKYKVTLTNGAVYNFDLVLSIELLPNGDFKYCLESGWG